MRDEDPEPERVRTGARALGLAHGGGLLLAAACVNLAAGCADAAEVTLQEQSPYVVDREAPLGGNPGVGYRLGGRNQCTRAADREATIEALRAAPNLAVSRIQVLEECSQTGGNHVFAKTEIVMRGDPAGALQGGAMSARPGR